MTQPLSPCPWCGTTEHLSFQWPGSMTADMPDRPCRVICSHIDHDTVVGPTAYGKGAAITAWNTRLAHSGEGRSNGAGEDGEASGRFANYSNDSLAAQCRMQARENLDPEYSQFMTAVADRLAVPSGVITFEEAWMQKEAEGYRYGHDALENVRFGWEIALATLTAPPASDAGMRDAISEAQFLCDRLDDLDWSMSYDEFGNSYHGHVDPAHSRLKGFLATLSQSEGEKSD